MLGQHGLGRVEVDGAANLDPESALLAADLKLYTYRQCSSAGSDYDANLSFYSEPKRQDASPTNSL